MDRPPEAREASGMQLVFLHGPPGVGKLTVARALSQRTGIPVFHNHLTVDLLEPLFEFGSDAFVRLREEIWLSVFREAASAGRSLIFTFAPERTVRPDFPERCAAEVQAAGGQVAFVALRCARDELLRRIASPERARWGKLASPDRYRELCDEGAFDYPALPSPGGAIDTDGLAAERVAAQVEARLHAQTRAPAQ